MRIVETVMFSLIIEHSNEFEEVGKCIVFHSIEYSRNIRTRELEA